jgi:hypothetical protein
VKNVEMSSFMAFFSEIPNRSSTIVCIRVQWNHPDLSGCGAGWAVTRKQGWVQLSRTEEPVDTHWTVTVLGAD